MLESDRRAGTGPAAAEASTEGGGETPRHPTMIRSRLVTQVGFSDRTALVLGSCGIATVGELLQWTPASLLGTPHIGIKTLVEIETALDALGLALRAGREFLPQDEDARQRVLDPKGHVVTRRTKT